MVTQRQGLTQSISSLGSHSSTIYFRNHISTRKRKCCPDAVSRLLSLNVLQPDIIRQHQLQDPFCQEIVTSLPKPHFSLLNGILYRDSKIVLPHQLWQPMFDVAHNIPIADHLGYLKTFQRFSSRFWFPSMPTWIKQLEQSCFPCQETKLRRRFLAHSIPTTAANEPFRRVAIDCFGPLPLSQDGNKHILVEQDVFFKQRNLGRNPFYRSQLHYKGSCSKCHMRTRLSSDSFLR